MLKYATYCLLVLLPLYADSPLFGVMGAYGYSPTPAFSLIVLFVMLMLNGFSGLRVDGLSRGVCILFLLLVTIDVSVLVGTSLMGWPMTLRGESALLKTAKGLVTFASIAAYIVAFNNLGMGLNKSKTLQPFFFAFILLSVIAVLEGSQMPDALPFFHANGSFPYYRPRFLTTESSWTSIQVLVYGGLALYYSVKIRKSLIRAAAVLLGITYMLATTGSKSLLGTALLVCLVGAFFACMKDIRWVLAIVPAGTLVLASGLVLDPLMGATANDVSNYTSTATRMFTGITALIHSFTYPFGVGNWAYLSTFPDMLTKFSGQFASIFPSLNLREVFSYVNSSGDVALSAKAGVLQFGIYWGIVGNVILMFIVARVAKQAYRHSSFLGMLLVVALVHVTVFSSAEFSYEFFALLCVSNLIASRDISNVGVSVKPDGSRAMFAAIPIPRSNDRIV